jgi:transcriptional regulator with XRE-family HTH domain
MSIHIRLRQLIAAENVSVASFEKEIGVGKNTVATILRKESSISHTLLKKIRKRYSSHSIYWLISGKDENDIMQDCLADLKSDINALFAKYEEKTKKD